MSSELHEGIMTVLKTEDGNVEYPDLISLIKAHPEIEAVALVYRWEGKTSNVETPYGTVEYVYDRIDWEYSYVGEADDRLLDWAGRYEIWDDEFSELTITSDRILQGAQRRDDDDDPDTVVPDCTVTLKSVTSADAVGIYSITLPSGKRIVLK